MAVSTGNGEEDEDPPAEEGRVSAEGSLVIPMEPRTEIDLNLPLGLEEDDAYFAQRVLPFAFGVQYPKQVVASLDRAWFKTDTWFGDVQKAAVTSVLRVDDGPGELGLSAQDGKLIFDLKEEGSFVYVLEGRVSYYEDLFGAEPVGELLESDFWAQVEVRVIAPVGADLPLGGCSAGPSLLVGAFGLGGALGQYGTLRLVDDSGAVFSPLNTTVERPVTVTVQAAEGTELNLPNDEAGVGSLMAQGPVQTLTLETEWGHLHEVALIEVQDIDGLEVEYRLWSGRDYEKVVDGGSYQVVSFGLEAVPTATYRGVPLCTQPDSLEYALVSSTEEICPSSDNLGTSTPVPGVCRVQVVAPAFSGGNGLFDGISFELTEAP
jgi:hypothetical protein